MRFVITALLAALAVASHAAIVPGKIFDRIVIILLENQDYSDALKNSYFSSFSRSGAILSNYMAASHPSQPNYVALIAGSTSGVTDDDVYNLNGKTIVDLLEAKGISWKSYQEDYPGGCSAVESSGLYYRKHNPFISFKSISGNQTRCAKIVPATELDKDIARNAVPQYVFYTPNINNDGHNTDISTSARWLKAFLKPKLSKPSFSLNTLVVVTYDESEDEDAPNQVFTALLGPVVSTKGYDNTAYTHYSVLSTIEKNWNLGNLGQKDVGAPVFNNLAKNARR